MQRFVVILLSALLFLTNAEAAQVTDMYGRSVSLPGRVAKVVGASPPVTWMVYTIDPSLLAGLNTPPDGKLQKFLRPGTMKLPVVGGFGGPGRNFSPETLMMVRPDVAIAWPPRSGALNPRVEQILASAGIPSAYVKLDKMSDYPAAYEFLGTLLGKEERGKKLAAYFRSELKKLETAAARIPENKRVSVYFAEEIDGLTTVSSNSVHGEAVVLAGGRNVHRKESDNRQGKDKVSLEQVIAYDPEVIIAQDDSFFANIYKDPRWAGVRAVRNHRVYLIPDTPFDWMDRPPSFLRLLGAKWLAGVLYPQSATAIAAETRAFYRLFFDVNPSDAELRAILNK
ncbi:ABC transporter substrate-binding protein [Geobacter sp. SVR]|uniref:ABC transporter substrate-binding protein n=1 Tax=Geobacter sp. SVR TaxID=2495594 RepID=UPI00143F0042|nr:ABC transporter substrate-binding protein [Geobacter sp. SVR]BCS55757.1 ABC transporter substrate-binding protein [Geobacter sp. SVR]GCF83761.1 iron ABC transporter substrate-binding protein [Geobacter sp. SVR]